MRTQRVVEQDLRQRIRDEVRTKDDLQMRLSEHEDRRERQTQQIKISDKSVTDLKK